MKIKFTQEGKVPVTSGGVGLFFEDLNYDLDGGLYAEMLENRNFEAKDVHGEWDHYIVEEDGGYGWEPYPKNAHLSLKIKTDRALFPENPHYLRIETEEDVEWNLRQRDLAERVARRVVAEGIAAEGAEGKGGDPT